MASLNLDAVIARLRKNLKKYGEAIPGLWKVIDEARAQSSTKWPSWCFAPIELVRAVVVGAALNSGFRDPKPLLTDLVATTMLAAWRTTQGIYVFDPDVQSSIWNTSLDGDIPSEVLLHLPEWCCFVCATGSVFGEEVLGFLVSLNKDSEQLPPELWLLVIYKDEDAEVEPLCLTLTGSITDAIAGGLAKLERTTFAMKPEQKAPVLERLRTRYIGAVRDLAGMVSLVLYLAADNREISNPNSGGQPTNPKPTKTKRGVRIFPASEPKRWDVGWRLGAALRQAQMSLEESSPLPPGDGELQRTSPRGHIRRAHWHSFWSGARTSSARVLRVKWLPPTAINLQDIEDLPATIHKVGMPK